MGKLDFRARTLDDEFVKEGLCAVSALEDNVISKGLSFVVGGVATQSYLPTIYRRPTSDIDMAVLMALNYEDFKEFSKSASEYLSDKGYDVHTKKGHISMQLVYSNGEDAAMIEFPRRNQNNFEKRAERLKREMEHTRNKLVEGRNSTYKVSSPEDIAIPKMVRGVGALGRNHLLNEFIKDNKPLIYTKNDIYKELTYISELRDEATLHPGNPELAEELRFISDIFDIRALSEQVGFNSKYLEEVIDSWDVLKVEPSTSQLLINYLLPEMYV